jgi:TM2 domain-containing membrane protein YozV
VAALLAILLGGLGIHKFYLGQNGKGILYLIFCWTYIPGILSFIEGIIMLCSNDENFQIKYKCRLG